MLFYNFDRIFKIRGIDRPYTFLVRNGLSTQFASKVKNNRIVKLHTRELEKLCLLLNCTPNDLMMWTPEKDVADTHHLHKLHPYEESNLIDAIHEIPLEKMKEIEELIRNKVK